MMGWFLFFHSLSLPTNCSQHFTDSFLELVVLLAAALCLKWKNANKHLVFGTRIKRVHKQNLFGCEKLAHVLAVFCRVIVWFVAPI